VGVIVNVAAKVGVRVGVVVAAGVCVAAGVAVSVSVAVAVGGSVGCTLPRLQALVTSHAANNGTISLRTDRFINASIHPITSLVQNIKRAALFATLEQQPLADQIS